MRFRLGFIYSVLLIVVMAGYSYAQPQSVTSTNLIEDPQRYDGKEVIYEGEVIGETMQRKEGVWVNISDGEHSIGVWMPVGLTEKIRHQGSYKVRGDIVRIRGIFNHVCLQHGGDLDIHASSLSVIQPGWLRQERMIPAKRNFLIILTVIACLILILRISIIR